MLEKFLANEAISQDEMHLLLATHALDPKDLFKIATWKFSLDDESGSFPDFKRKIYISCLNQTQITEEIVGAILEQIFTDDNLLVEDEPYDVFPYWWEVFELALESKKVPRDSLERMVSAYLIYDYDEDEVLPEMQKRLLRLAASFTVLDSNLIAAIADKITELEQSQD